MERDGGIFAGGGDVGDFSGAIGPNCVGYGGEESAEEWSLRVDMIQETMIVVRFCGSEAFGSCSHVHVRCGEGPGS